MTTTRAPQTVDPPPRCGWPDGCHRYAVDGDRCDFHATIEDALWLLDSGEPPEAVCTRVGITLHALAKALKRLGLTHSPHYRAALTAADRHYRHRTTPTRLTPLGTTCTP